MMFPRSLYFLSSVLFFTAYSAAAQGPKTYPAGEIQLALKKLNTVGAVLYVAAHPDDENTRLLSYLANEKLMRTGYLSITRGDGGQNLIGTEQAELLGAIRTQELLAARRTDGAEQFFTRANDFGFSKTPEETMAIWGKENILADVVWVIRKFRPDIIITRFPITGEGGHGHHTASAILAEEAFTAAADPLRFPEQLKYVEVWQAKRLVWNSFNRSRDPKADMTGFIQLDIGAYNSLLGKSYGEIAAESRSMHKSQGFGSAKTRGPILEYFKQRMGDSATTDIFQGMNFSWNRLKGTEKLSKLLQEAHRQFKPEKPEASVPALIQAYVELNKIENIYWRAQKTKELEQMILACAGLWLEAYASDHSAVPGSEIKITASAIQRSSYPFQLERINFPGNTDTSLNAKVVYNEPVSIEKLIAVPPGTLYSNPYWLELEHGHGLFYVTDQSLIGSPENESSVNVSFMFSSGKQTFTFTRPVVYKWVDPVDGEKYRPLEILPPVTLNLDRNVYLFTGTAAKDVKILLKAGKDDVSGNVRLTLPDNWKVEPSSASFSLKTKGEETSLSFRISPPQKIDTDELLVKAEAVINEQVYNRSITRITHPHIPIQTLLPKAESRLVHLDLKKNTSKIGYIPGADDIPPLLEQLGYEVTILTDEMLKEQPLKNYDAIILGIRVYNTNERMKHYYDKLMGYVQSGGTMIVQYNTNNFLGTVKNQIGPYPFKISRDRVTVEEAPVSFERADHPILNTPNKIGPEDFEGWIQERGLYFATELDPKYETIFSMNDPGEKPHKGSLILSKFGQGYFMYTGISFFRELPAGVPGAYRLFVNMISYGK